MEPIPQCGIGFFVCGSKTAGGDDYEKFGLKLIPYYAFANRGETEMQVWFLRKL